MGFYYFFLVFVILMAGRYKISSNSVSIRTKNIGFNVTVAFIIVIAGFRFNVGFDWHNYLSQIYPVYNPNRVAHFEPLSLLYIKIAGALGRPYIMYCLFSCTIYLFVALAIKNYSDSKYESLIIYIALLFFDSLSTMRQAAAVAIAFYAFKFIKEKKIFKYFLFCFIAFLFHKSAIVLVVIYFIYYLKPIYNILGIIFSFAFFKVIVPKILARAFPILLYYYNSEVASNSGNFVRLFYLLLFLYCLFVSVNLKGISGLMNICAFGTALPFILGGHTGGRVAQGFIIYFLYLLPKVNKRFSINYKAMFMIPFYIFFLLLIYVGGENYFPYKFYFFEDLSSVVLY